MRDATIDQLTEGVDVDLWILTDRPFTVDLLQRNESCSARRWILGRVGNPVTNSCHAFGSREFGAALRFVNRSGHHHVLRDDRHRFRVFSGFLGAPRNASRSSGSRALCPSVIRPSPCLPAMCMLSGPAAAM